MIGNPANPSATVTPPAAKGSTKKNVVDQNDPQAIQDLISDLTAEAHSAKFKVKDAETTLALLNLDEKITEAAATWKNAEAEADAKIDGAQKNIEAAKKGLETAKVITADEVEQRRKKLVDSEKKVQNAQVELNTAKETLRTATEAKNAAEKHLAEAQESQKTNEQRYNEALAAHYKVQTPEEQEAATKAQRDAEKAAQQALDKANAEFTKVSAQCEVDKQTAKHVFLETKLKFNREKSDLLKDV